MAWDRLRADRPSHGKALSLGGLREALVQRDERQCRRLVLACHNGGRKLQRIRTAKWMDPQQSHRDPSHRRAGLDLLPRRREKIESPQGVDHCRAVKGVVPLQLRQR